MHSPRRDADRSGQRRLDPRHKGGLLWSVDLWEDCRTSTSHTLIREAVRHRDGKKAKGKKESSLPLTYVTFTFGAMGQKGD